MWPIIKTNFLFLKQRWIIFALMLGMSIVLTVIFGASFSQEYRPTVYYFIESQSEYSQAFSERLEALTHYNVIKADTLEKVQDQVKKNQALAGIVLDDQFTQLIQTQTGTFWIMKGSETVEYAVLKQEVASIISSMTNSQQLALRINEQLENQVDQQELVVEVMDKMKKAESKPIYSVSLNQIGNNGFNQLLQSLLGFAIMFSMYVVVFGIGKIINEKHEHVWERQVISRITMPQILLGNGIATVILGSIQICLMIYGGKLLTGISWGGSNLLVVIILVSFIAAVMSIGLLFTTFLNTESQLGALAPVFITSTSMLGGCMWPIDMVQVKIIRDLANFTPQKWAMEALTQVVSNNGSLNDIYLNLIVLWGIAIGFFILGSLVLSKRKA